jgi:hypothetical protein
VTRTRDLPLRRLRPIVRQRLSSPLTCTDSGCRSVACARIRAGRCNLGPRKVHEQQAEGTYRSTSGAGGPIGARSVDEWTYGASSALVRTEAPRWSAEVTASSPPRRPCATEQCQSAREDRAQCHVVFSLAATASANCSRARRDGDPAAVVKTKNLISGSPGKVRVS